MDPHWHPWKAMTRARTYYVSQSDGFSGRTRLFKYTAGFFFLFYFPPFRHSCPIQIFSFHSDNGECLLLLEDQRKQINSCFLLVFPFLAKKYFHFFLFWYAVLYEALLFHPFLRFWWWMVVACPSPIPSSDMYVCRLHIKNPFSTTKQRSYKVENGSTDSGGFLCAGHVSKRSDGMWTCSSW